MNLRFFITALLLVGCSDAPKELMSNFETDFPKAEELIEVTKVDSIELNQPLSFVVKDSLLFVIERGVDYFGKCFNINTGKEVSKFILKGKSNTEMMNADAVALYGNDSIIVKSGNSPRLIKTYSPDIISNRNSTVNTINLPDSIRSYTFTKISDNTIFGAARGYKYFITNPGKETIYFEKCNKDLIDCNIELEDNDMTWNSIFAKHPSENKIAVACRDGLMFEVVNLDDKKTDHSKYYVKINMTVHKIGEATATSYRGESSCTEISSNENNIFAVKFSMPNFQEEDYKKYIYNFDLLVFDWKLNPIKRYAVPSGRSLHHISQDGKYLYILRTSDDEFYSLIKYEI